MRRALWVLVLAAGCASQPDVSGPVANTGTIVGDPTSPRNRARVHTDLATLYYARGAMSVALEEARIAVAADPTYASGHGALGLVYMELRENALAEQSFRRGLAEAPEDPDINHNFAGNRFWIGNVAQLEPAWTAMRDELECLHWSDSTKGAGKRQAAA